MNNKIQDRLFIKDLGDNYILQRIKDGILTIEGDSHHVIHGIEPFYKLSIKNCEAIKRGYDLDELTEKFYSPIIADDKNSFERGIKIGFEKGFEMISDKKFSEDDVLEISWKLFRDNTTIHKFSDFQECFKELIQSRQKTEWDVVIDTKDSWEYADFEYKELVKVPKFDSEGCVILKIK